MATITIYELKKRNIANGGHFFDADTMKTFGDTMKRFKIKDNGDGTVTVERILRNGKWTFNKETGRMIAEYEIRR